MGAQRSVQSRASIREFAARMWESRKALSSLTRWLLSAGLAAVLLTAVCFTGTAVASGDAGYAFEVLTTVASPFRGDAAWFAVPLAVAGYLLLPAVVGAVAALIIERQLAGMSKTLDEAEDSIRRSVIAELRRNEQNEADP
jgi:heme A synthase